MRATRVVLERLSRTHAIDCYTLSSSAAEGKALEGLCSSLSVMKFRANESPWPSRLVPLRWMLDLRRITEVQRRIAERIHLSGYDVCFACNCLYFEVPSILRHLRVPAVYYSHSASYPEIRRPGDATRRRKFGRNPLGVILERRVAGEKQAAIESARCVLTNSFFSREELFRIYGVNAIVNYLGVDSNTFRPDESVGKGSFVLGVGSLTRFKAHDFSIRAIGAIPEAKRPELVIACHFEEPGERNYLSALAGSYGVRLSFRDKASVEELTALYNSALATLFPSVFEPLGLVPLESMACGTPVVGVAEGGIRETVVDGVTGFLTQRDPAEFSAAIVRLLSDPALAAEMGRAGRQHVMANWNWDRSIAQLESVLRSVTGATVDADKCSAA